MPATLVNPDLARISQEDFSAGSQTEVAPTLIDERGVYEVLDGLFTDDGAIRQRGGSVNKSNATFGSELRFLWDGFLKPGRRTLFANSADFGVLAADDLTPVNVGGPGMSAPLPAAETRGLLFLPGGWIYGGSRKTASYSAGTVSVTNGSKVITGASTLWAANADAGMIFRRGSERVYVVESVDSDTQITLEDAYEGGTAGGQAYILGPTMQPGAPYEISQLYAVCADRLCVASENRVKFGTNDNPHAAFAANDFHEFPEGCRILGFAVLRLSLIVFTTAGVWELRGLEFPQVDASGLALHRIELENRDLILFGAAGIATWESRVVAPCLDGIWLVDGVSQPTEIGHPIEDRYRTYVESGYKPGQAVVYRSHYFLPILAGDNTQIDLLVCRLDRPIRSRRKTIFPWSFFRGNGGNVSALAVRVSDPTPDPQLLGAGNTGSARVMSLESYFSPSAGVKNDANGSPPILTITTRDFATGDGNLNTVLRVRVRYELLDAGTDNPTLNLFYSKAGRLVENSVWGLNWGAFNWAAGGDETIYEVAPGAAPESDGANPHTFRFTRKTRFIRLKIRANGPSARLTLRSIELFVRPSRTFH